MATKTHTYQWLDSCCSKYIFTKKNIIFYKNTYLFKIEYSQKHCKQRNEASKSVDRRNMWKDMLSYRVAMSPNLETHNVLLLTLNQFILLLCSLTRTPMSNYIDVTDSFPYSFHTGRLAVSVIYPLFVDRFGYSLPFCHLKEDRNAKSWLLIIVFF